MAKTVSVVITDDLDGSPGAETATFSLGGQSYEIDLSVANLARLKEFLRAFMDAGCWSRSVQAGKSSPR